MPSLSRPERSQVAKRRIEVAVTHADDGRPQVVLRDLSYGPGVGWYAQKSVRLDAREVEALMGALCCARGLFRREAKTRPAARAPSAAPGSTAREAEILRMDDIR